MAAPAGTKQVTMYIDMSLMKEADAASEALTGRRNGRTEWVTTAIREKLERDGAVDAETADDKRLREIVGAYRAMDEGAREWLHIAARLVSDSNGSLPE